MKRRKENRRPDTVVKSVWQPRYLRTEMITATAILVICLFVGAGVTEQYIGNGKSKYIASVQAALLVDYANTDREALKLSDLHINQKLVEAAQLKANDMAAKGYFSHTTPEGYNSWHWFEEVGYDYAYAGENLAVDFSDSRDVQNAWMASPTHRDNIVNPAYTEIGIATAEGMYKGHPAVFAVQMFGRPQGTKTPEKVVTPVPAPVASARVLGETTVNESTAAMSATTIPWWAKLMAQPKTTLRYAYLIIGLLILAALFGDMEWEIHKHHLRHALKAGYMLATMSMLFIVADWMFFAEPILAAVGKMF